MVREKIQSIIDNIQSLPLEILQQVPELERTIPKLYDMIQIEDECAHVYINGQCICGKNQDKA